MITFGNLFYLTVDFLMLCALQYSFTWNNMPTLRHTHTKKDLEKSLKRKYFGKKKIQLRFGVQRRLPGQPEIYQARTHV